MGNGGYTRLFSSFQTSLKKKKSCLNKNKKCRTRLIVHGELKSGNNNTKTRKEEIGVHCCKVLTL